MLTKLVALIGLLSLAACQATSSGATPTLASSPAPQTRQPTASPQATLESDAEVGLSRWTLNNPLPGQSGVISDSAVDSVVNQIHYTANGVTIDLSKLEGWTVHFDDDGIVLIERMGSIMTGGALEGMVATMFVPPLDEFDVPSGEDANLALCILRQVTASQKYVGNARVTRPLPFDWGGYDAAYYLMTSSNGTMAIVLAVTSPRTNRLLVFNISAPGSKAYSIRPMLPVLLRNLSVDGLILDARALAKLPDPLEFPLPTPFGAAEVLQQ